MKVRMKVAGVRIKVQSPGAREVLSSEAVANELSGRGERIADAAGEGFESRTTRNRDRVVVFVSTATNEAREAEAETRALTRAIDAGR